MALSTRTLHGLQGRDLRRRSASSLVKAGSFSFAHLSSKTDRVYIILRGAACEGEDLGHVVVSNCEFIPGQHLGECLTL